MKLRWLVPAAAVAVLALAACSSGAPGSSSTGVGPVGYSARYLKDPFQAAEVAAIPSAAKAAGVNMLPVVSADNDPAKQNQDIQSLVDRGIKGLIVNAVNSQAIVPAIKKLNAAKIPVVTVDTPADGGDVAMQVTSNNYQAGENACEAMAKALGSKGGTVLNLQGDLTGLPGQDRSGGFTDCMKKNHPEITVVSKPMDWDTSKCSQVAQAQLTTAKFDGVFIAGTLVCLGPVETILKSIGRFAPVGQPNHMAIVGIDGSADELAAVRAGTVDAVVSQPLDKFAKYSVYWIKKAINGDKIVVGKTDHNSTVVKVNGILTDKLPTTIVTKENVDDPTLWGNQQKK